MHQATENKLLHTVQYVCHRNLPATAALNKKLTYDIIRQIKIMTTSFYDAKGCYNFIVPPHTMIACQTLGLTKKSGRDEHQSLTRY